MAKSKKELFQQDIEKAMDSLAKAQKLLAKADGRLPKTKPKMVPQGSEIGKSYGNTALQDILKDLYHAGDKTYQPGTIAGTIDALTDIKRLLEGECGFEF